MLKLGAAGYLPAAGRKSGRIPAFGVEAKDLALKINYFSLI